MQRATRAGVLMGLVPLGPPIDLPGLGDLRESVANRWWPKLPGFAALRR